MPKSLSTRALLLGGPFLFCFVTGQIGGWGGPILFGMLLLLLLWMPCMMIATGGPIGQVWPSFLPLAAGIAGFVAGESLPAFVGRSEEISGRLDRNRGARIAGMIFGSPMPVPARC